MITNSAKPVTSIVDSSKISIGETWGSIPTTWASETRTWLAVSQLFKNLARQSSTMLNTSKPS